MGILPRRGRTNQPRATPWDLEVKPILSPERALHGPVMFRPFRAHVSTSNPIPGRCPGLICGCPFGATDKDAGIDAKVSKNRRNPQYRRTESDNDRARRESCITLWYRRRMEPDAAPTLAPNVSSPGMT
jgi:hypothetical protein